MATPRRGIPRELDGMLAFGCVVFAALAVFIVGLLQVGVPSCVVCTPSAGGTYCNGNDLSYCNGGLPVLAATLAGLSLAAFGFGIFFARAYRRTGSDEERASGEKGGLRGPAPRTMLGLSLSFDGVALASLGLWMAVPPMQICMETCTPPPYALTGIPLGLVVVGAVLLVPGIFLLRRSRAPRRGTRSADPRVVRST